MNVTHIIERGNVLALGNVTDPTNSLVWSLIPTKIRVHTGWLQRTSTEQEDGYS